MKVEDFVYQLPQNLIARYPRRVRTQSRLFYLDPISGSIEHRLFHSFEDLLAPGDLLVMNDTRVIPARLFGRKLTGGKTEILIERVLNDREALAQIRLGKLLKIGSNIHLEGDNILQIKGRQSNGLFHCHFKGSKSIIDIIESYGHIPLPPYLDREDEANDRERYQTVYAQTNGAVAAPTAGLHFDRPLMNAILRRGVDIGFVTLHVGLGTFQPVRVQNVSDHHMAKEFMSVSEALCQKVQAARLRGGKVVAVGTTAVRCLETAAASGELKPFQGETDLFIYPGYPFKVVNSLLTNFHLPGSTLLMLVCAFGGHREILEAYDIAIENRYRFYSYGDAMYMSRPVGHS